MLPSPGWLVFTLFVAIEALLVLILVAPMPSNQARGIVVDLLLKAWSKEKVRYTLWTMVVICSMYCYDSLYTCMYAPVYQMYTCEQQLGLFYEERMAYATGMSVFLFFVLRRMLDIQQQLFNLRMQIKGTPVQKKLE